jgi:hypothetical protein
VVGGDDRLLDRVGPEGRTVFLDSGNFREPVEGEEANRCAFEKSMELVSFLTIPSR